MKKLMIAAAIVCAAAFAQAASYNWAVKDSTGLFSVNACEPDWDYIADGTAVYLAFVSDYSQDALLADFNEGKVDYTKFIADAETIIDYGAPVNVTTDFEVAKTADDKAYYVIFEDGKVFLSDEADALYDSLTATSIKFADMSDFSDQDVTEMQNAGDGYGTAGWYQTSSVPEPTTGLLMLIGMAGLALRRRRA